MRTSGWLVSLLLTLGVAVPAAVPQDCCCASARGNEQRSAPAGASATHFPSLSARDLRGQFNASSQDVRIVALLSPTCAQCQSGHAVVGRILKKFSTPRLRALLVWEPMRETDSPDAAAEQANTLRDRRISQGWDGSLDIGKMFGATLALHQVAWDVYLIYKPGITWEGEQPPPPTFWMHQLDGVDPGLLLCVNPARLGAEVDKLLKSE
jgi:hypothetical protein